MFCRPSRPPGNPLPIKAVGNGTFSQTTAKNDRQQMPNLKVIILNQSLNQTGTQIAFLMVKLQS